MVTLETLLAEAENKMTESYAVALEEIQAAMEKGHYCVIFNSTVLHNLVSNDSIHSLVANQLKRAGFTVTRNGGNSFSVSGWDTISSN